MQKFNLIKATLADRPVVENMWYYYVYDLTRYCGFIKGWESPTELSFKSDDLTKYFTDHDSHLFLINIDSEHIGFVCVKKLEVMPEVNWFMSEFFIISKYQRSGIGRAVAKEIFEKFPGEWAVGVLPAHIGALSFWRKIITKYTHGKFYEVEKTSAQLKTPDHPDPYPMIMIRFKALQGKSKINVHIRQANESDILGMVALSDQKRQAYESAQPQFWGRSVNANESQAEWFKKLLIAEDYILLIAETDSVLKGFIIGRLMPAPEVYNPGGLTLMVDDFCVAEPALWYSIGHDLIVEIKNQAKEKGAVQLVIVSGHHDESKRQFLKSMGLSIVSEWYLRGIV